MEACQGQGTSRRVGLGAINISSMKSDNFSDDSVNWAFMVEDHTKKRSIVSSSCPSHGGLWIGSSQGFVFGSLFRLGFGSLFFESSFGGGCAICTNLCSIFIRHGRVDNWSRRIIVSLHVCSGRRLAWCLICRPEAMALPSQKGISSIIDFFIDWTAKTFPHDKNSPRLGKPAHADRWLWEPVALRFSEGSNFPWCFVLVEREPKARVLDCEYCDQYAKIYSWRLSCEWLSK